MWSDYITIRELVDVGVHALMEPYASYRRLDMAAIRSMAIASDNASGNRANRIGRSYIARPYARRRTLYVLLC